MSHHRLLLLGVVLLFPVKGWGEDSCIRNAKDSEAALQTEKAATQAALQNFWDGKTKIKLLLLDDGFGKMPAEIRIALEDTTAFRMVAEGQTYDFRLEYLRGADYFQVWNIDRGRRHCLEFNSQLRAYDPSGDFVGAGRFNGYQVQEAETDGAVMHGPSESEMRRILVYKLAGQLLKAKKPDVNKPAARLIYGTLDYEREELQKNPGTIGILELVRKVRDHCDRGDVEWGLGGIEIGLATHPSEMDEMALFETRGDCLAKKGDRAAALKDWEIALRLFKKLFNQSPRGYEEQVELEIKLGRCREALSHLDAMEKYDQSHPDPEPSEHNRNNQREAERFYAESRKACAGRKNQPEGNK